MIRRSPRPKRAFTIVANHVLEDCRLSFKATGLLVYILSKPDNWRATTLQLAKSKIEGPDAIRTALRELEAAGYIERRRYQDQRGRWAYDITVFDYPQISTDLSTPRRENPHEENPHV